MGILGLETHLLVKRKAPKPDFRGEWEFWVWKPTYSSSAKHPSPISGANGNFGFGNPPTRQAQSTQARFQGRMGILGLETHLFVKRKAPKPDFRGEWEFWVWKPTYSSNAKHPSPMFGAISALRGHMPFFEASNPCCL